MAKSIKRFAFLMALLLCLGSMLAVFSGCDPITQTPNDTTVDTGNNPNPPGPGQTGDTTYSIQVKTVGGMALAGVNYYVYEGKYIVAYGTTDQNGMASNQLEASNGYSIQLTGEVLNGYTVEERYSYTGTSASIVLTSAVRPEASLDGVTYRLGSVVHDFAVVTSDNETVRLSEILKEKKAVMLNFWYSTCNPCVSEFPYMQSAYEKYGENIEIIALNHYKNDTADIVKFFKIENGLSFPMAKDYTGLQSALGVEAYPTNVVIDRYGVICLIEMGGLPSERPFQAIFEHFGAENYQQKLFTSVSELTPTEKPNVAMPSSEELNAAFGSIDLNITYRPYTGAEDAEYAWPFVIDTLDSGETCVHPSNAFKESSFAFLYADVELNAGDVLAFDWYASTEYGADILYVIVNDNDIYQIYGESSDWKTCYAYVATEPGTYEIALTYIKDDTTDVGHDTVYLKNLRKVRLEDIDNATYIPRYAATDPDEAGIGFGSYVTPVFNETDGYYHVGSADGPLLLADLLNGYTPFHDTSVNLLGYSGSFIDPVTGENYYEKLVQYCNYALNASIYGLCPVNEELRQLLIKSTALVTLEPENENVWLQVCTYYDAYGPNAPHLEDPIKGLANFSAFDAVLSTEDETVYNSVTYDRLIMPRGLKYLFTPEKSGVYVIKSQSDQEVNAWIFLENGSIMLTYENVERSYTDQNNCYMIVYLEAGQNYYIDIAYYDLYAVGTFTFTLEYLADTYEHFRVASPGYFTFEETVTGTVGELIVLGIDVVLHTDGYYHELREDGSIGSIVYADFLYNTAVFSHSIAQLIDAGAFDFSKTEDDQYILSFIEKHGEGTEAYLKEMWGTNFDVYAELYNLYDVLEGKYHGTGVDLTDAISAYLEKMIIDPEHPEREGCVAVDAGLAELLQLLMDKFTFQVDDSWTKLCYYYEYLGPASAN